MANKFAFEKRINEMKRAAQQLAHSLPMVASTTARDEFEANFQVQGLRVSEGQVQKWRPRQRDDRKRKSSLPPRPILVKTGKLKDSLLALPQPGLARVATDVVYARIHNRGGRIKGQMRAYATNLRSGKTRLRKSGSPAYMPARPFMVQTPLLRQKLNQALHEEVVRVMKPKGR